jgi:calcium/calmodulin-dependent 3',5'-cyclic nucleotide phosphodiesterase
LLAGLVCNLGHTGRTNTF